MPRDLSRLVDHDTLSGMSGLSRAGDDDDEQDIERAGPVDAHDDDDSFITELSQRNEKRDELHPYTQTLSLSDVESCVRLEEATFPPQERCTREKADTDMEHRHVTIFDLHHAHDGPGRRRSLSYRPLHDIRCDASTPNVVKASSSIV
ncbi:uncharacterized protein MYCFIDRAFT_199290 [Pseudocercospora fijiensis CIRAD86]|uniref:Uncharacterized protein n=1 Tax=Pseudocercospora fijiensis (strain CIRAD86) TaxID=383855 RepID=M3A4N2_PSEFD|nr:uncharacterized protein MYCFIDRAFT_199290 [Pseudocercospora fijiensis CIRAD86]EME79566.1 hypothetical protein MYCFIDRAFT_199290 [Pseudocercospora fijiensis CIRAD86]